MDSGEVFTVWSSKYALTGGIKEIRASIYKTDNGVEYYNPRNGEALYGLQPKSSTFRTYAEAAQDADRRRLKKIASLKKQITALEKLTF